MDNLDVQQLLDYFESRLRQQNEFSVGAFSGEGPCFPMSVVYLGEESAKAHGELRHRMLRIWPPYREELFFVGVQPEGDDFSFFALGDQGEKRPCSDKDVGAAVSRLFSTHSHFHNFGALLNFFLLDTSAITSLDEFRYMLSMCRKVKMKFAYRTQSSVLLLLLNEQFQAAELGAQIRNELAEMFYGDRDAMGLESAIILSNYRADNKMLTSWEEVYRIAADLAVLGNSQKPHLSQNFFVPGVKTVGYAKSEKPSRSIAQVVVSKLLQLLDGFRPKGAGTPLFSDPDLPARLGFTSSGTLALLDEYADSQLFPLLPTPEQMELFPRYSMEFTDPVVTYTSQEFDALTMGSWSCFLSQIAWRAESAVADRQGLGEMWQRSYRSYLSERFSADELVELTSQSALLRRVCFQLVPPNVDLPVLECAQSLLHYNLSADPQTQEIFYQAIAQEAHTGQSFLNAWSFLIRSLNSLFKVGDDNLNVFYQRIVQSYVDLHSHEIQTRFAQLSSVDQLWDFLRELIDQIIASNPIFAAPFEEELQQRLEAASDPNDARSAIREQLTGDRVVVCFNTPYALPPSHLSALLLKTDTTLHKSMAKTLKPSTFYYNTGCGDAAEAIELYQVPDVNLVS